MSAFTDILLRPDTVVIIAAGAQIIGYLLHQQVRLRLLLLLGTLFDILYYAIAASEPLWTAIATSSALALANLIGLGSLLLSRSTFFIKEQDKALYQKFGNIEPGEFRGLMKLAKITHLETDKVLTVQDVVPDALSYVVDGEVTVEKDKQTFQVPAGCFIGEVSIILGEPASATVSVGHGGRIVQWDRAKLTPVLARNIQLNTALEALLARDMAVKVASAVRKKETVNPAQV